MLKYKLESGEALEASSPSDFVTKLRQGSRFDSDFTDPEFMERFAQRYKVQKGTLIRFDTPENFLEDLISTGYLE
jgi:hypothetical protein